MELLGSAVDINQQEIVKKQVLEEIVLVEPLPVSNGQTLYLERSHLAESIYILSCTCDSQHIFKRLVIIYLEILIALDLLGICTGLGKFARILGYAGNVSC